MRVLVLTHGSRGDIEPFVALAKALAEKGHVVSLGIPHWYSNVAEGQGLRLVRFDDAWSSLMTHPKVRRAYENDHRGLGLNVRIMYFVRPMLVPVLKDMASAVTTDVDVIVHHAYFPGHQVAERLGVPAVPVCLQPQWVPTSSFADFLFPAPLPKWLYKASYLWTRLLYFPYRKVIRRWRSEDLNLPVRRGHQNVLRRPDGGPATVLQAFSRHILPAPLDYSENVRTVGFWALSEPCWVPPRELVDFLESGTKPIYVGFGSLVSTDPRRSARIVSDAVRAAGVRAVVVGGLGGIAREDLGDDLCYLDDAPFSWLFPRVAAVVHHGGAGTTGAALAAGCPQVVCPFFAEHRFFAERAHAVGVAVKPIPQHKMSADNLAVAIDAAMHDTEMATRAAELGRTIRAENGPAAAVDVLEAIAAQGGLVSPAGDSSVRR